VAHLEPELRSGSAASAARRSAGTLSISRRWVIGVRDSAAADVLDAAGQRSPFAEYDHFYASSHPDPEHTWLICKPCHTGLTTGGVPRDQREAEFRAYQSKRRRLGRDTRRL